VHRRPSDLIGQTLALLAALVLSTGLQAHDFERTTVHLTIAADGHFELRLAHDPQWLLLRMDSFAGEPGRAVDSDEARDARLRALAPQAIDRVVLFVDGREIRPVSSAYTPPPAVVPPGAFALASYTLRGQMPPSSTTLRWYYGLVADPYPFTLTRADGTEITEWVQGDAWSSALSLRGQSSSSLTVDLQRYVWLGITHIVPGGIDHMLFIAGLFLLTAAWRSLLWQVSAFTLAHTLTLGLALTGLIAMPSTVVEPLIALSISYVGLENVRSRSLTPSRLALVFAFGLLHGLGFAGVMQGLRLPSSQLMPGLLGFNIGVELGQLVVLGSLALITWPLRHHQWYHRRVVVPASLGIALIGLYWAVTRFWQG
jgi:hypothetical protein